MKTAMPISHKQPPRCCVRVLTMRVWQVYMDCRPCDYSVIPAQAGIHDVPKRLARRWIPACAGMTDRNRLSQHVRPQDARASKSFASGLFKRLCMLFALTLWPAFADAATITLVDEQLNLQSIALQSMDEQTITFFDEKGNYQTRPINRFLQLRLKLGTSGPSQQAQKTGATAPPPPDANAQHNAEQEAIPNEEQHTQPAQPNGPAAAQASENAQPALPQGWGIVELIDGQRLTGRLIGNDDAGQVMQWEHPQAGLLTFKLDHVRQWRMSRAIAQAALVDGSDRLYLANGDTLLGFVSAVTTKTVSFIPQGTQEAVAIELSRVKALGLANVPLEETAPVSLVVLADETRLRAKRVVIERGELRFAPLLRQSEQWVTLPLSSLRRLDFANERWQLLPWSTLPRKVQNAGQAAGSTVGQTGGMVFAAPWPVRQTDEGLHLHAPSTITFTLPAGTAAIAATAALDIPLTHPAIGWADFVVRLQIDDAASAASNTHTSGLADLARLAINETNPQGRLHAKISQSNATSSTSTTRTLTLTLDPALNGPIMDRLKLTDAWVVVKRRESR